MTAGAAPGGGADSGVAAAPGGGGGGEGSGGAAPSGGGEGKAPLFSVRAGNYRRASTLNICDAELVGTVVEDDGPPGGGGENNGKGSPARRLPIKASYYGGATVGRDEAARMLSEAQIANIAGRRAVGLAVSMGLGAEGGVKTIGGVPFLIVFR